MIQQNTLMTYFYRLLNNKTTISIWFHECIKKMHPYKNKKLLAGRGGVCFCREVHKLSTCKIIMCILTEAQYKKCYKLFFTWGMCKELSPVRYSGDLWNISRCEFCTCDQGRVLCHNASCESTVCFKVTEIQCNYMKFITKYNFFFLYCT